MSGAAAQPVDLLRRGPSRLALVPYDDHYEAEVLAGCREMHAESVLHRDFAFDDAKVLTELKASLTLPHVYLKLCVREGEVLGGFFGMISGIFFSHDKVAVDRAFFVKKSYRGSLAATSLLDDFERWAKARGVHHVLLEQATGIKMDATTAFYRLHGYEPLGLNMVKRI